MNEQQLAAVKQALEALKECRCDPRLKYEHPFYDKVITDLEQVIAQDALDWMAKNARDLGLSYDDNFCDKNCVWTDHHPDCVRAAQPAQPAVQEGRDWSLLEATQESLREHMAEIKRLKAEQPVPVKTYHDGKPWPVAPKPWVNLADEEVKKISKKHKWHESNVAPHLMPVFRSLEAKLKEKNT
jgi:hypothetical protein